MNNWCIFVRAFFESDFLKWDPGHQVSYIYAPKSFFKVVCRIQLPWRTFSRYCIPCMNCDNIGKWNVGLGMLQRSEIKI